jgi:hypothetical protein
VALPSPQNTGGNRGGDTQLAAKAAIPWHFWVVVIVGLLWNGYGCYDYFMTTTGGEEYLRSYGMTEEQIAYYAAVPSWMTGVWGGRRLGRPAWRDLISAAEEVGVPRLRAVVRRFRAQRDLHLRLH